jgi:hypothetical protein
VNEQQKARLSDLSAAAVLAATVTLFFADILFAGLNLYIRDIQRFYYPYRAAIAAALRSGELPFWNHLASGGQPLAANPVYELFYPPQWLVAFGDLRTMVHLEVVLHYPVAAVGFFLLARSLGCRRWVAMLAAFSFALSGLMLSFGSFFPFLFSMTWLPWIAFFFHRWATRAGAYRLALSAICLGLLLLAADVAMIIQAGALLAGYAAMIAWKERRLKPLGAALIVIALAVLIGAVQIFPALDHQHDSGRGVPLGIDSATTWSMPPLRPLEMIWPTLFGAPSEYAQFFWGVNRSYPKEQLPFFLNIYPGLLVMIVVITGFGRRIRGTPFVAAVAVAGYLLAIGRFAPLFPLMYRAGFRSIRYPEKFFVSSIFVLAIFAAIAAEEAVRDRAFRRSAAIVAGTITLITAAISVVTFLPNFDPLFATFWRLAAVDPDLASRFRSGMLTSLAIASIATFVLAAERLSPALRATIVALVVFVDIGIRVDRVMPRITADYYTPPPAARLLANEPQPVRIYSHADWQRRAFPQPPLPIGIRPWILRNGLLPHAEKVWGFEDIGDFDPDKTKLLPTIEFDSLLDQVRRTRPDRMPLLLAMGGVTHVSTLVPMDPRVIDDPRRFDQIAPVTFTRIRNNGRFYFARQLILDDASRVILSNARLPIDVAFTPKAFTPAAGRVDRVSETPNRIELEVESAGRGFLVLAITPHKYWRATIDGRPAILVPANVGFQGLVVDAGRHRIVMQYRNPIVIVSGWISIIAFSAVTVFALRSRALQQPSPH